MKYDPLRDPDQDEWSECDEMGRIEAVFKAHDVHTKASVSERLHATFHIMVENQLVLGEGLVRETLERLLNEGLDRHDAIHAIGSVLAGEVYHLIEGSSPGDGLAASYHKGLAELTAKEWRDAS